MGDIGTPEGIAPQRGATQRRAQEAAGVGVRCFLLRFLLLFGSGRQPRLTDALAALFSGSAYAYLGRGLLHALGWGMGRGKGTPGGRAMGRGRAAKERPEGCAYRRAAPGGASPPDARGSEAPAASRAKPGSSSCGAEWEGGADCWRPRRHQLPLGEHCFMLSRLRVQHVPDFIELGARIYARARARVKKKKERTQAGARPSLDTLATPQERQNLEEPLKYKGSMNFIRKKSEYEKKG